jgi:biotin synthase-related radical SAM superfamily protein
LIRVSIGTVGVLGLAQVQMAVAPTTAYLMLGERCTMNCAFCAQARQSQASEMALSRVSWPAFPLDQVCVRLEEAERRGTVRRCCIQVTVGQDAYRDTLATMRSIRQATRLPLDVAILPADMEQVAELIAAGADHVGFGLDAACARVFRQVKGQHWRRMCDVIAQTASQYPGRAAVHLIVGLGETEQEMVERMSWAHDRGTVVGLFAFTPVRGTVLADRPPPSLAQYRRMQAARWLIVRGGACLPDFAFDERGALRGIAVPGWPALLACGEAFRTSGCPDCNRPFYNERPGGTMYNYPRPLTAGEAQQAIQEMEIKG